MTEEPERYLTPIERTLAKKRAQLAQARADIELGTPVALSETGPKATLATGPVHADTGCRFRAGSIRHKAMLEIIQALRRGNYTVADILTTPSVRRSGIVDGRRIYLTLAAHPEFFTLLSSGRIECHCAIAPDGAIVLGEDT